MRGRVRGVRVFLSFECDLGIEAGCQVMYLTFVCLLVVIAVAGVSCDSAAPAHRFVSLSFCARSAASLHSGSPVIEQEIVTIWHYNRSLGVVFGRFTERFSSRGRW